ncbi:MAG: DUF4173 domain-containing protein [Actinobacteria bacterium]|nr:DUF4173 domain-containing protein [Actinomycetota bacterium]
MTGLVLLAATNLANPDAFIARTNLNHHIQSDRELDTDYLTEDLSSDAVPVLVANLDRLDACTSNRLLTGLLDRPIDEESWQGLTWGEQRAKDVLTRTQTPLLKTADGHGSSEAFSIRHQGCFNTPGPVAQSAEQGTFNAPPLEH